MKRVVILCGVLIVLVGISAFMWSRQTGEETDTSIAATTERYSCKQCGAIFELTNEQATEMLRKGEGVVCPTCNQVGADKQDVKVMVGGLGGDQAEEPPPPEPDTPPDAAGGVRRLHN